MGRIWAKLIDSDKIVKQCTYNIDGKMQYSKFFDYLTQVCEKLDIATPMIIKTHIFNFAKFNFVKFTKSDFIDSFEYEKLVLEYIIV